MMNRTQATRLTVLLASLIFSLAVLAEDPKPGATAEDPKPDATIEIEKRSAGFIIKGARGTGTLFYQGGEYPFTVSSVGVGGIGAAAVDITGNVYYLNDIKDFPGKYASGRVGIAIGVGQGGVHMSNNQGVEMWLRSRSQGVALQLGVDAITIRMAE